MITLNNHERRYINKTTARSLADKFAPRSVTAGTHAFLSRSCGRGVLHTGLHDSAANRDNRFVSVSIDRNQKLSCISCLPYILSWNEFRNYIHRFPRLLESPGNFSERFGKVLEFSRQ